MAVRLTDKFMKIFAVGAPDKRQRIEFDSEVSGFAARVTAKGAKAFILDYRVDGRQRRLTIGRYPAWSVDAARKEARELRKRIDRGEDPLGERHEKRAAPTVAELCDRYLEEHAEARKRPSSVQNDRANIARHVLPALGRKKVGDVKFADIDKLHRSMKETPYAANRVHALVRKMFALAIKWGYRADNPAIGVERYQEEKRERFLSPAELAKVTDALGGLKHQGTANAIRLLILTGARRGEVLAATWDQFDMEAGIWNKPSAHTKQRKEHRAPLNAPALQLLTDMKEAANEDDAFVFPGRGSTGHITEIKKAWKAVCEQAGLEGVRIHDLRHTFASILASSGLSLPIIGKLLGHTQTATTARYAHLADDPLREAAERVGAVVTGGKEGEVIPLKKPS